MNEKIHQQVRNWIDSEELLDAKTEAILQEHLRACPDCRNYVDMIIQLREGTWNPFPRQRLSQAESQKIAQQIRPQIRSHKMNSNAGNFSLSSALGIIGLIAVVGLFALAISQLNQTAVSPADQSASYTQYDGWETGLAFQFPATWTITDIDTDGSAVITFATPLDETAESCESFMAADSSATIWIVPADAAIPATPLDFLKRFVLTPIEEPQTMTVNGRSVAYALAKIPCAEPFDQMTVMVAETETHYALVGLRHAPDDAAAARTELETIVSSLTPVDYTGWQPWRPNGFSYTVMAPTGWNVFDSSKSLEVTPNQQPMWSSFAAPDQPVNAPRIFINHNLNAQFGETTLGMVERSVAQMQADLPSLQAVDPPAAHPVVPGVVTAVYATEDTAVFFGAINYPRDTVSLDPIGATATVPLDQLDSFRLTFERILRSLNGYYVEGVSIRDTIRGSDFAPTATPFPVTKSPFAGGESPTATPTPYDFVTVDPAWTATPFPTLVPQDGPLPITPTPTPAEFSDPGWTPTPFLPTPTSIPNPNEP